FSCTFNDQATASIFPFSLHDALPISTTSDGVPRLVAMPEFDEVEIVLDATSAAAHVVNARILEPYGRRLVDLTPAAIGPFVVPRSEEHTSELQSRENLVCRLLLEKKK